MRLFHLSLISLLVVTFFCSSCATLVNGTKQKVIVHSHPEGAKVIIHEQEVGVTPLTIKQSPKKPLQLVFEYPGYEPRKYILKNRFDWQWFLLDGPVCYAGVSIPFAVDLLTQAPYRFVEKEVTMNFDSAYVEPQEVKPKLNLQGERIAYTEEEKQTQRENEIALRMLMREERIKHEFMLDSTKRIYHRRSVDSSRVRNYKLATQYKNAMGIQLSGLILGEVDLYYCRNVYKSMAVGVEFGYKIPDRSHHTHGDADGLDINGPVAEMMIMPFTESYYLGLSTKIPIPDFGRGLYYVSFTPFVRNSSFDHAVVSWENQTDYEVVTHYDDSVGVHQRSAGIKILMGIKPVIKLSDKLALEVDLYSGISLRNMKTEIFHYLKTSTIERYSNSTKVMLTNVPENQTASFLPLFQLGFKIGVRF